MFLATAGFIIYLIAHSIAVEPSRASIYCRLDPLVNNLHNATPVIS